MAITESRLKAGTLEFGASTEKQDVSSQLTSATVTPTATDSGDAVEVLSGDLLGAETTTAYVLKMTVIQDWTDDTGVVAYSWDHDLEEVAFTWKPAGATGPTLTGTVQVRAIELGGEVNTRLTSDVEWPVIGVPVRTAVTPGLFSDDDE